LFADNIAETHEIVFMEDGVTELPEELKNVPINLDHSLGQPFSTRKKDYRYNKSIIKQSAESRKFNRKLNRYRINK